MFGRPREAGVTDVQGVWEYTIRYLTVISIKQKYGGSCKASGDGPRIDHEVFSPRFVIIVDDDIDPF